MTGTFSSRSGSANERTSLHARSLQKDKHLRVEQGLKRLVDCFEDLWLVRRSKFLIDTFDLVKLHSDAVAFNIEEARNVRSNSLRRAALAAMKSHVKAKEKQRINLQKAGHAI